MTAYEVFSIFTKQHTTMTEILVFDRNGKITFRSVMPMLLTQKQVDKELSDYRVDVSTHRIQVIYTEK